MLPDRVSNPGPLTYESGALLIAIRGPARTGHDDVSRTRMITLAFILSDLFPLDGFRYNLVFAP